MVEFRILGSLEVWHADRPINVGGARQRELLAVLLLHAGQILSTDRLMDALWGDRQPAAASAALRVHVSRLRKALGPGGELLVTRGSGYGLMVGRDALDLARFERLLGEASGALASDDHPLARQLAAEALSQWRGAPLADFAYAPFAQAAIVRLEELRLAAQEVRIEAELALGRRGLVGELQTLVEEHPLRERLWAQLMRALYREGRQAEALAAYRSARTRLVEDVGIEPGPELQRLQDAVLAQDPGLDAAVPAPPPAQRRCVLAVTDEGGVVAPVAERLAASGGHDLVLVRLVAREDSLRAASTAVSALREAARGRGVEARAAAFTSADPAADAVRLAAEQDAAVLVLAGAGGDLGDQIRAVLRQAVCDVVVVAGGSRVAEGGAVLVPFAGHEHDWSAAEVGAWLAGDAPLRLLGSRGEAGRDASRLLASASLALQRGIGIAAEPVLVERGADSVLAAAEGAAAIVAGLSDRWAREGLGKARREIATRAECPVLLVRGGLRPGGLAPPQALTRFTWSGGA